MSRACRARAAFFVAWACLLLAFAPWAHADTHDTGDTQVTGQVGVGTLIPQATMEVRMSSSTAFALKVSSANAGALFAVTSAGNVGIGLARPQAHLDTGGKGDTAGNIALQLRVGNSSSTLMSQQIIFASTAGYYQHAIATRHESDQAANNAMRFLLWNSTGQPTAPASLDAMAIEGLFASTASVHIAPAGTPDVELEVSNGLTTGGGTIHRAAAATHSSRALKDDIAYLGDAQRRRAYEDVKALRHATFQYKSVKDGRAAGPVRRGLIYEDSPDSVRGDGKTIVLDYRVLNLEMALQEAGKKISTLEVKISELEKRKKAR